MAIFTPSSPSSIKSYLLIGKEGRRNKQTIIAAKKNVRKAPSLVRLARRRKFETIVDLLTDPDVIVDHWFEQEYSFMGENCLHFIMKYKPPVHLVSAMVSRLQVAGVENPELVVDLAGRTALHHACMWLCSPSVIYLLTQTTAGVVSARSQDLEGRLPLHYITSSRNLPSRWISRKSLVSSSSQPELVEVLSTMEMNLKLLVSISPRTSFVPDDKGCTALDCLQKLNVANETCRSILQNMEMELNIAMDLCQTAPVYNRERTGLVVKFPSETSVDDDVSVLSFTG